VRTRSATKTDCGNQGSHMSLAVKGRVLHVTLTMVFCSLGCGQSDQRAEAPKRCSVRTADGFPLCCGNPGELPGLSCIDPDQDGGEYGLYGHCTEEGKSYEAKIVGARCCEGLTPSPSYTPSCQETGPPSLMMCLACGDGLCSAIENKCNCPGDCS
jgi:hypothetical protein